MLGKEQTPVSDTQLSLNLTDTEATRLEELETVIQRGLATFVEVGTALAEVRDDRLYRGEFGTFEDYCRDRWGFTDGQGRRYIRSAEVVGQLAETVPIGTVLPTAEAQARELARVPEEERAPFWNELVTQRDDSSVPITARVIREQWEAHQQNNGLKKPSVILPETTYACRVLTCPEKFSIPVWHCLTCDHHWPFSRDYCANCHEESAEEDRRRQEPSSAAPATRPFLPALFTSDTPEWYTPEPVIARAIQALGAIDLDPCSNSQESPNVPAARHYTAAENGLSRSWDGRVYMNPPYGDEIGAWVEKLCGEFAAGRVTAAVALVPARTDTKWFRRFRDFPRCFVDGRLRFSGHENSAPFPSCVVYLGADRGAFCAAFADLGDIYERVRDKLG